MRGEISETRDWLRKLLDSRGLPETGERLYIETEFAEIFGAGAAGTWSLLLQLFQIQLVSSSASDHSDGEGPLLVILVRRGSGGQEDGIAEVNIEPIHQETRTGPELELRKGEGKGKGEYWFFSSDQFEQSNTCYCNDVGKHPRWAQAELTISAEHQDLSQTFGVHEKMYFKYKF